MAIIAAFQEGTTKVYTKSAYQFDKKQKLIVTGVEMPNDYEVHISNDKDHGIAGSYKGDATGVVIPDAYFMSGEYVYVWIYAYSYVTGEEGAFEEGKTVYEIVIPVIRRPVQVSSPGSHEGGGSSTAGYIVDDNHTLIPVIQ